MTATDLLLSERDRALARRMRKVGLVAAPVLLVGVWALAPDNMNPQAARLMALIIATMVLWTTRALPLPATALLAPALGVAMDIAPAKAMFAPFAHPLIYLFVGAFLMAMAAERTRLDRRMAAWLFPVGRRTPRRMVITVSSVTALLSGFFSNSATTAMMVPVVRAAVDKQSTRFEQVSLLNLAYAASIGGVITPIGTPPNLIAIATLLQYGGSEVPFLHWMIIGLPLAVTMLALWYLLLIRFAARDLIDTPTAAEARPAVMTTALRLKEVRPVIWGLDRDQLAVLAVIGLAAFAWMLPGALALAVGTDSPIYKGYKTHLPEGVIALICATMLFVIPSRLMRGGDGGSRPVLEWAEATQIDWGTIVLFGGGLALGQQAFDTGLSQYVGNAIVRATGVQSEWGLVFLFSTTTLFFTELVSNTATAAILCPLAVMTAQQLGLSPVAPCIATALAASMAFLMPISTPPNAIVFGTGRVPLTAMLRWGIVLDLLGVALIPPAVIFGTRLAGLV